MDNMLKIFVEQIKKLWEKVKNYVKEKIKKIICNCKCQKTD